MSAFIKKGAIKVCVHCETPFKVSRKHFKVCSDECYRLHRIQVALEYYHVHVRRDKIVGPVDPAREATILLLQERASKKQPLFPIHTADLLQYLPKGE